MESLGLSLTTALAEGSRASKHQSKKTTFPDHEPLPPRIQQTSNGLTRAACAKPRCWLLSLTAPITTSVNDRGNASDIRLFSGRRRRTCLAYGFTVLCGVVVAAYALGALALVRMSGACCTSESCASPGYPGP